MSNTKLIQQINETTNQILHFCSETTRVSYVGKPCFIFNEETDKWTIADMGVGYTIPSIFTKMLLRKIDGIFYDIYLELNRKIYDSNFEQAYSEFKIAIHQFIVKNLEIDQQEEKEHRIYLTFEMQVNISAFIRYHLLCLFLEAKTCGLALEDLEDYDFTIKLAEYFGQTDSNFILMAEYLCENIDGYFDPLEFQIFMDQEYRNIFKSLLLESEYKKCMH